MALKHVTITLLLNNVAAGVGTALPPYKHRRGFFARGGGFAIGNTSSSLCVHRAKIEEHYEPGF